MKSQVSQGHTPRCKAFSGRRLKRVLCSVWICMLTCSLISSCGFQLRGSQSLPLILKELKLECSNVANWQLCQSLREQLRNQRVKLDDNAEIALSVMPIESTQRVLSIQKDASAAEHELIQSVRYRLIHTPSQQQIVEQSASVDRSYRYDSSALLANERESNEITVALSQQLATIIVRQISVYDQKRINRDLCTNATNAYNCVKN